LVVRLRHDHTRRTNWKDAPVMGTVTLAATEAASKSSGSALTFPILIVLVFVGFYFLMIRPQRRRQQQAVQKQNTVTVGARVRTTAGMYATVTAVDGDDVVLEVAPGVEVRYLKRAIMEVIAPGDAEETYSDAESYHDEPADDEVHGTDEDVHDVKSAEDGPTDSHAGTDEMTPSDKDNVR
jgi:preprotein translocase subunit YajC